MKTFDLNKDVIYTISPIREYVHLGAQYGCRIAAYSGFVYPIKHNEVNILNYNHWISGAVSGGYFQTVCAYPFTDLEYMTGSSAFMSGGITPIFDISFGVTHSSSLAGYEQQISGNAVLFSQKNKIYKTYAGKLLGDSNKTFNLFNTKTKQNETLNEAIFLGIKRNHLKDGIFPGSLSILLIYSGSAQSIKRAIQLIDNKDNIENTPGGLRSTLKWYDVIPTAQLEDSISGVDGDYQNAVPVDAYPLPIRNYGYVYYDLGIIVLSPHLIYATASSSGDGYSDFFVEVNNPELLHISGSDLSASFSGTYAQFATGLSGSKQFSINETFSAMRQRIHSINFNSVINQRSTFYRCVAEREEYNYSSNPTYLNNLGEIITASGSSVNRPSTYITRIGMLGKNNEIVAIGALSRPVKKTFDTEIEVLVRLDY